MTPLNTMPNIGQELAHRLQMAGIATAEQLKIIGSEKAFLKLKTIDPMACINQLYALEGAIEGIRWHLLDAGRKRELNQYFKQLKF